MAVIHIAGDSTAQAGFSLTPTGMYDLRIDSYENKPASAADKSPYTMVSCTIIAADNGKNIGQKAMVFLSHSPKSAGMVRQFLEQANVRFEEIPGPQGVGIAFDPDHLVGSYARGKCTHREWNGQMRENWGSWEVSRYASGQQQAAPPVNQQQAAPPAAGVAPPVAQGFYPPTGQQG